MSSSRSLRSGGKRARINYTEKGDFSDDDPDAPVPIEDSGDDFDARADGKSEEGADEEFEEGQQDDPEEDSEPTFSDDGSVAVGQKRKR